MRLTTGRVGSRGRTRCVAASGLAAALMLGGCSSTSNLTATGNETSVVVSPTAKVEDALPIADKHCSGFKRIAHFKRLDGDRAIFECDQRAG